MLSQNRIDKILEDSLVTYQRMGNKTLIGLAILENGFEIVESCSCLNAEDFDLDFAMSLVKQRLLTKLSLLEGYNSIVKDYLHVEQS